MAEFQLRAELRGHDEDVRCLCITDNALVTGSRDKTIKLWQESGPTDFVCTSTLVGHTDYVSALAFAPSGRLPSHPQATVISGSRDNSIIIWDLESATPVHRLTGHQYQVSAVDICSDGSIVSGSLDKTVRVWKGEECVSTLQGHEAAVLSVMCFPDTGDILSGSGDCTIKAWSNGQCVRTIPAHSDSVRGLAPLPGIGAVSASHDATLKVWTLNGDCIAELVGHSALVYCVATTADGSLVASGSEDNTAKIWTPDGASVMQTIEHPGTVWAVAFLPNGDLVTACSDHVARVWTRAPERKAAEEVIEGYNATMAARKAAAEEAKQNAAGGGLPEGLKLEEPAVLQVPGTRDGQTKVVKEGSSGVAYSWNAATTSWERIGEVVGGDDTATGGGKKWHNGQEWDFVFDVDISDDAPALKLALNADENPYIVAERFIEQHGLSEGYRDQIVQFILQNTTASVAMQSAVNVDPYTGGASYVPRSASAASGGSGGMQSAAQVTGGGVDPYTGSAARAYSHFPATAFLQYDALPAGDAVKKKLLELNAAASPSPLEESDMPALDALLSAVCQQGGAALDSAATDVLHRILAGPAECLFPALDIARLVVLNPSSVSALDGDVIGRAITTACSSGIAANQQTALRLLCNCFLQPTLREWMRAQAFTILDAVAGCAAPSASKNIRQGLASLIVNYSVLLSKLPGDELELKTKLIIVLVELVGSTPVEEGETLARALIALGTMGMEHGKVRALARDLGFVEKTRSFVGSGGRLGEVAGELERLLKL